MSVPYCFVVRQIYSFTLLLAFLLLDARLWRNKYESGMGEGEGEGEEPRDVVVSQFWLLQYRTRPRREDLACVAWVWCGRGRRDLTDGTCVQGNPNRLKTSEHFFYCVQYVPVTVPYDRYN